MTVLNQNKLNKIPPHMIQDNIPAEKVPELLLLRSEIARARGEYESLASHLSYLKSLIDTVSGGGIGLDGGTINGPLVLGGGATIPESEDLIVLGTAQFAGSATFSSGITNISEVDTDGNFGVGTVVGNAYNVLVQPSNTVITTFVPNIKGNFLVYIYMRVVTESTVRLQTTYNDEGGRQIYNILNDDVQAVGTYSIPPIYISSISNNPISISAEASGVNSVYLSANIIGL